jgi:hypothetical protein
LHDASSWFYEYTPNISKTLGQRQMQCSQLWVPRQLAHTYIEEVTNSAAKANGCPPPFEGVSISVGKT